MLHIGINGRSIFRQMTGVQHYAREVTLALERIRPADVRLSVFAGSEGRAGAGDLPLQLSTFPANGPVKGLVWEQTLLKRMTRKAGIDLLFNPANVAPLNAPVPSVVTIHDLAFLLFPEYFSRTFALYYRTVVPRIAAQAARVLTDSNSTKTDLINYLDVPEEKIAVVPLGVSPEFRRRILKSELEEVRARHKLPARFFLSISSLEPRKNLGRLLEAYRMLPEEIAREHALVLAGAGNRIFADSGLSKGLAAVRNGKVYIPGYIPDQDLPAIYRMSTALVFPSLYEGFGLPVLEAMSASTPVVTSSRASLPEVAGHAAVQIDPESAEEIAAAMELLASDSGTRKLLIERGKKRAAGFTWEKTAAQTLEVLRSAGDVP